MWQSAWSKCDPNGPHVHLGPIGVVPEARGRGIGRRLMNVFCEDLDRRAVFSYLETDRAENTRFYAAFGFEVINHAEVLGVTNYFMRQPASLR